MMAVLVDQLSLFPTETGDAWLIDPSDQLAARLARGGGPEPTHIEESDSTFAVGWKGRCRIEEPAFIYIDRDTGRNRTHASLDLKQVKTVFGFSHRPHKIAKRGRPADQVVKAVEAQSYDLTVFRVKWRNLTLKIYDKGGRMLRIEVVAHNVKDLRSGKVLDKLPELLKRMREMLVRFLGTVQAAHVAFLDEGAFERWSMPTQRGTRRLAGIDLNKARNRHLVDAVVALSTRPGGFTLAQMAERAVARRPLHQGLLLSQCRLRSDKTQGQESGPPRQGVAPL
jgi:hypothetical protein